MFNFNIVNKIVLICYLLVFIIYCSENKTTQPENESSLVGNWKISSMSWNGPTEVGSYNQEELDSLGIVWNINLNLDKSAEQITNLSGPVTTQPGTWSTDGDKLILRLKSPVSEEIGTMIFTYSVEGSSLILNWAISGGTIYYIAEFTKD